jgi:hypothetical protein
MRQQDDGFLQLASLASSFSQHLWLEQRISRANFLVKQKSNFKSAREVFRRVIQSARVGHVWESKVELTDAGL